MVLSTRLFRLLALRVSPFDTYRSFGAASHQGLVLDRVAFSRYIELQITMLAVIPKISPCFIWVKYCFICEQEIINIEILIKNTKKSRVFLLLRATIDKFIYSLVISNPTTIPFLRLFLIGWFYYLPSTTKISIS